MPEQSDPFTRIVFRNGSEEWRRDGKLHRDNGPAVIQLDGYQVWYHNGERRRDDGPAIEWADGSKDWWRNGKLHRDGGPAVEGADGKNEWYQEGKLHRDDGPAIEYRDGAKEWWLNGFGLSSEEFNAVMEQKRREIEESVVGPPARRHGRPHQGSASIGDPEIDPMNVCLKPAVSATNRAVPNERPSSVNRQDTIEWCVPVQSRVKSKSPMRPSGSTTNIVYIVFAPVVSL